MSDTPTPSGSSRRYGSWAAFAAVTAVLAPSLPACDPAPTSPEADRYVTEARLIDQADAGTLHNGFLPAGSADGPAVTPAAEESTVINGGSLQVPVTATACRSASPGTPTATSTCTWWTPAATRSTGTA